MFIVRLWVSPGLMPYPVVRDAEAGGSNPLAPTWPAGISSAGSFASQRFSYLQYCIITEIGRGTPHLFDLLMLGPGLVGLCHSGKALRSNRQEGVGKRMVRVGDDV